MKNISPSKQLTVQDFNNSQSQASLTQNSNPRSYRAPASVGGYDVALGMSMEQVVGNWGRPDQRDIAGNPTNRNERWAFYRNGKTKFVYFEQGYVQGWSER